MTLVLRLLLAALGGAACFTSFEPLGWWWAGILGLGLLYFSHTWGDKSPRKRTGALLGFVFGLGLYLPLLPWVGEFVGAVPWVALAITESLYFIVFGAVAVPIARLKHWGPLAFALWFISAEFVRSNWPFGGFAWGRLGWGQIDGPLAQWASIGGPALVTFVAVLAGACIAGAAQSRRFSTTIAGLLVVASFPVLNLFAPTIPDSGEVKVAAIQGNVPRMGLDFNAQRRAVLANHARVTGEVDEPVDLVIWPENSSDVNPFADQEARKIITEAVADVNAPTLVGTITVDEVGPRNTMVVFNADGTTGDYHHKKFLQPFGEYMPYRDFFRKFSSFVDMAGNFQPGTGNGIVHMNGIAVGVATCYEVAFDAAARTAVDNGAQILTTPTNNATFGFTDMTYQQMAMSRMRAIETDRAVIVAATSGSSALIRPDGSIIEKTAIFQPATLIDTLPLRDTRTIASRFGHIIEWSLVVAGLASAILAILVSRRDR
ncbi:Apolipoprotein N-acyltransferase [Corynebacterium kalinowskii]|uniref:Apolipoprotein N-acyltransferase n=1 Tax=Corynebacterium kalinowskii TaxID=2675216 RepID=A0A6B8VG49_9CORY|nr:apolipoprotein N-acyltransferase [Corynebacterium kalinowskii]QGU01969.1 Apolipoprotein N-acyltransferase [Corynebacterium kalinowskii]